MIERIGLGGGCHWCAEAVFQALRGVARVQQGFIAAAPPDDSFSEAVLVDFDIATLPLYVLIEVHLRTHASTSAHKMRRKYRSAVYVEGPDQRVEAQRAMDALQLDFNETLVTRVLWRCAFRASDERFHNYYATDPKRPFCKTYIDPKLSLLREQFKAHSH